jgi:DNA-binding winged helix-turn-helix (wHTH) protein
MANQNMSFSVVEPGRAEQADSGRSGAGVSFGPFRVVPEARQLLQAGRPISIGGRAFDLLTVLVDARGSVVATEVIRDRVWPSMVVEESNLRSQVAKLRRALGRHREMIKTVRGRGYMLAVDLDVRTPALAAAPSAPPAPSGPSLPARTAVVVIEDDDGLRERLCDVLRSAGLDVRVLASASTLGVDEGSGTNPTSSPNDVG